MKAFSISSPFGFEAISQISMRDPGEPGQGEIRVRLYASSLNGHDLAVALGQLPVADGRVLLTDGAGVVEAVGAGVNGFVVGDCVVSVFFPQWLAGEAQSAGFAHTPGDGVDGFACEVVVRPESAFTRAPKGYSHIEAATLTTAGLTAWRAVVLEGKVKPGDTVMILGTGGVSTYAVQLAKAAGAVVLLASSSDEKLECARQLGADHVINYRNTPQWQEWVLQVTQGRGVDLTVELGGPGTLAQSIQATRIAGHIVLVGMVTGFAGVVPTVELMARNQRLTGIGVGSRQQQADLIRALEHTGIRPVIDSVFALDQLPDAFSLLQSGKHFGKIALDYSR